MKLAAEMLRDLVLLFLLGLCAWLSPKTTLAIEAVCGIGTLGLFLFERKILKAG